MAELGSGTGTGYPTAIDSDASLETATDYARTAVPNDLGAAIVAIETELGVLPKGSYATVVARLNGIAAKGTAANRPAASAIANGIGFYYSTDTGILEMSDGTTWFPILLG